MKNRIVINLEQQGGATPLRSGASYQSRRRRWPKVLGVFLLLCVAGVLIAGIASFFWWRHYQTTPAYSLAVIVDAAQRDDMATFQSQFDDEQLARNLVASVREKASSQYGLALTSSVQSKIDTQLPSLLPQMKDRIHTELAKEVKELSARAQSKPFVLVALAISSSVKVTSDGNNAHATALIPDRPIEIVMHHDGNRWKVVDFKDDVLVQRVVAEVIKDLPPIGALDLKIPLVKSSRPRRRNR